MNIVCDFYLICMAELGLTIYENHAQSIMNFFNNFFI